MSRHTGSTGPDGTYLFDGLLPGKYTVVIDPSVFTSSTIPFDFDGGADGRTVVDLTAGSDRRNVDFGLAPLQLPTAGGGAGLVRPAIALLLAGFALLMVTSRRRRLVPVR